MVNYTYDIDCLVENYERIYLHNLSQEGAYERLQYCSHHYSGKMYTCRCMRKRLLNVGMLKIYI